MSTLTINKVDAIKAFEDGDDSIKKAIRNLFGNQIKLGSIKDRVKTFEDACAEVGKTPEAVLPFKSPQDEHERGLNAMAKMRVIAKALNEGWTPDWSNSNQRKWYPWFEYGVAGFGFSFSYCGDTRSSSCVFSRLCFQTEELAEYAGKQFIKEFNDFLIL